MKQYVNENMKRWICSTLLSRLGFYLDIIETWKDGFKEPESDLFM